MSGKRQPTDVVIANGRKHLTKAEIAERMAGEVKLPPAKTAKPPEWLPEGLKQDFRTLGRRLIAAGLYAELDADTLGRYLTAQQQYAEASCQVRQFLEQEDVEGVAAWIVDRNQPPDLAAVMARGGYHL